MFGSANLTNTGITGRTEMGILIDDSVMVAELGGWFDTLWQQIQPPIAEETSTFIQWLDEEAARAPIRREKFSLSASSNKIRSHLVKLIIPETQEPVSAPLNLDAVAQTLIIQEQRHYESLEEALESAINALAFEDFSFGQVVAHFRQAFPTANMREIYFALLRHCANHVRSVFTENTRNRLVLIDGRFMQSTKEILPQALASFDAFLSHLIHHFDFNQVRDLPDEEIVEGQTGIAGRDQVTLVSELTDCGFLNIEDVAGHLPLYALSEDFIWEGRYKLFATAMHDWVAKKNRPVQPIEVPIQRNVNNECFPDGSFSLAAILDDSDSYGSDDVPLMERHTLSDFLRIEKEKADKKDRARKEKFEQKNKVRMEQIVSARQEGLAEIDKVLYHVFLRLLSGEHLQLTDHLLRQLSNDLSVESNLVQKILSGDGYEISKLVVSANNRISINPNLEWKDLMDYPLTQGVC